MQQDAEPEAAGQPRPRRSPAPGERQSDAERSRRQLLAAALDVFAAKGFAGARVQEIADRAGVNKQLINYYFGGKEGLYRELRRTWLEGKASAAQAEPDLAAAVSRLVHDALADPRQARLTAWSGLAGDAPPDEYPRDERVTETRRRLREQLAADVDPATVRLVMMSAAMLPVVLPNLVRQMLGADPDDPEFADRYADQLRRIIARLHP